MSSGKNSDTGHVPVMIEEVLEALDVKEGGCYIDGTAGGGGHSAAILERIGKDGTLLALDRDGDAVERVKERLSGFEGDVTVVRANYSDIGDVALENGFSKVDGVLMDLGCSSYQLDEADRGFSFMNNGPLDMRMDLSQQESAEDFVNESSEAELISALREFGEERRARRIAGAIVRDREVERITTTGRLAEIVEKAVGGRKGRQHPATKTFQAVRIAVNRELESLDRGLSEGLDLLGKGGRMAVISFHSLEDRIVKRFFRGHAGRWESLQAGGSRWVGEEPAVKLPRRKPYCPSDEEVERNPRARSAKLRVAERL